VTRDRLKDVIISDGENISSVEVESVLLRHVAVQEVAILGFPHERWGEAPHAFVVLKQGARADERELREFARAGTSRSSRRGTVCRFVKELLKAGTGKIQKYILRAQRPAIAPQVNVFTCFRCADSTIHGSRQRKV
jgi:fatty-acyl-CoA synthase